MNGSAVQVTAAFIICEREHFQRNNVIFFLQLTHTIGKNPQTRAKYKIWKDNMLMYFSVTKISFRFPQINICY